jgi:hypothetical protein
MRNTLRQVNMQYRAKPELGTQACQTLANVLANGLTNAVNCVLSCHVLSWDDLVLYRLVDAIHALAQDFL